MSVRHDSLLCLALAREIAAGWRGRPMLGLRRAAENWGAELRFEEVPSLFFVLHPDDGYVLAGQATPAALDAPYRRLWLGEVRAPADERILCLALHDTAGHERLRLIVELTTNRRNLLQLDPSSEPPTIRSCLRPIRSARRPLLPGRPYVVSESRRRWIGGPPDLEAWTEPLAGAAPEARRELLLRTAAYVSPLNVDYLWPDEEIEPEVALERYRQLRQAAEGRATGDPAPIGTSAAAWLLERPWGLQPYPHPLGEPTARPFPSLLEAMAAAAVDSVRARRITAGRGGPLADEEAEALRAALRRRRQRLRRRMASLRRELEEGEEPEALRETGHLLLARLGKIPRGVTVVTLEGFDGAPRTVELNPALSPAANAEAFFERASKRERARRRIPPELARLEASLEEIDAALDRLERQGPDEDLRKLADVGGSERAVQKRAASSRGRSREPARLPYIRYFTSGGLELRVGRGARHNDALTFRHSDPEDIWLHARQVPGAHVILRWGRKDENPPRRDLTEAAIVAAVHSRARHSGTVAVDWTRRKYVRKPRKAPPGTVVLERAKTLFVAPDERVAEALRRNAG